MLAELALASGMQAASCRLVTANQIFGRDLAAGLPSLSSLPADQVFSLAPVPGQRRVFRSNELNKIARAAGLTQSVDGDICFEWQRSKADPETLLTAMRQSLAAMNATVELVEAPATPVPQGNIEFPLSALAGASAGPVVWRGTVTYSPGRTVPIWTRVRVTVREKHVLASTDLKPGNVIKASDITTVDYSGPFQREKKYSDPQQVIGLMPKNTVSAGAALSEALLRPVNDVERGDVVQVVVQVQSARIEAQGIAEEGGLRGGVVTVRNARSGRKFRARVESRDRMLVLPTVSAGLVTEESKS